MPKTVAKGGSDRCSLFRIMSENRAYMIRNDVRTRYDRCGPVGSSCDHIVLQVPVDGSKTRSTIRSRRECCRKAGLRQKATLEEISGGDHHDGGRNTERAVREG